MNARLIQRYAADERMNHWMVALLFVLAALSGLAFFHPALFFFSALFGGGVWTRILHPFIGVLMALSFVGLFARFWRQNLLTDADRDWVAHSGDMLRGNKTAMPPVGKYNAGQKGVFWVAAVSIVVLLATGITFWQPWFAGSFPIGLRRLAVVLHAASAVALVISTIIHVYAAIWVKGTIRAMTRGTVTETWARENHVLWWREMTGKR